MPTIQEIRLYPIKSLGGVSVPSAIVEEKGFRYDRRYMLITPTGQFITQRSCHQMALIDVALTDTSIRVWHRHFPDDVLVLPLDPASEATPNPSPIPVSIWDSHHVPAMPLNPGADFWFSQVLGLECRLVFMPESTRRAIDKTYARHDEAVSFADGYPYLVISQASLNDLNNRLPEPITMSRFRPNLIVDDCPPFDEDTWLDFQISHIPFYGPKPCARCVLTTIDPATGQPGKEPLRTLTHYRNRNNKILFGQNAIARGTGVLHVGDSINVVERGPALFDY